MSDGWVGGIADGLRRAPASVQGVDTDAISHFLDDIERAGLELHNLMLWRDGAVVAEGFHWPYGPARPRMTHSMTKSVTACAIGLLIDSGQLALKDRIAAFFPELGLAADSRAGRITVEDLLTMRTGHAEEVSGSIWRGIETSWVAEFFRIPIVHEPGTTHVYSSAASYMLSAIVTRVTGETIRDFLEPRLFAPLGIRDVRWDVGPDGINPGGNGISFTMADGMKLGILHAQRGLWEGRQILPGWWIDAATRAQGAPDYGYHWAVEGGYYAALGVFVQMVAVYPAERAVLGLHCAMEGSSRLRPHLERYFPAAFGRAAGAAADAGLAGRLEAWRVAPPLVSGEAGDPARFTGHWQVEPGETGVSALSIDLAGNELSLSFETRAGAQTVTAPRDSWRESRTTLPGASLHHGYAMADTPTVAGWRWRSPDRIELILHFAETAFRDTIDIVRAGDTLSLDRTVNINSGARAWPTLLGTRG